MADSELASFLQKFKALSLAGIKASLNAEAVNGAVSVILKADIGRLNSHNQPIGKYRSPAYRRRQERRRKTFIPSESKVETDADIEALVSEADALVNLEEQNVSHSKNSTTAISNGHNDPVDIELEVKSTMQLVDTTEEVSLMASDDNVITEDNENKEETISEVHIIENESCAIESGIDQNSCEVNALDQQIVKSETENVTVRPSYVTINATAIIEDSPNVKFTEEEWGSLLRFLGSKEHLRKNIPNVIFLNSASSQSSERLFKHIVKIEIIVNTECLWESPRSYIWRNIGQDTWTRGNGTAINLIRIHQK